MTDSTADAQRLLGAAVKQLRASRSLTQEELSARSGVHTTYISDVERGTRNPSWASLAKLVRGMDYGMADLGEVFDQLGG